MLIQTMIVNTYGVTMPRLYLFQHVKSYSASLFTQAAPFLSLPIMSTAGEQQFQMLLGLRFILKENRVCEPKRAVRLTEDPHIRAAVHQKLMLPLTGSSQLSEPVFVYCACVPRGNQYETTVHIHKP